VEIVVQVARDFRKSAAYNNTSLGSKISDALIVRDISEEKVVTILSTISQKSGHNGHAKKKPEVLGSVDGIEDDDQPDQESI